MAILPSASPAKATETTTTTTTTTENGCNQTKSHNRDNSPSPVSITSAPNPHHRHSKANANANSTKITDFVESSFASIERMCNPISASVEEHHDDNKINSDDVKEKGNTSNNTTNNNNNENNLNVKNGNEQNKKHNNVQHEENEKDNNDANDGDDAYATLTYIALLTSLYLPLLLFLWIRRSVMFETTSSMCRSLFFGHVVRLFLAFMLLPPSTTKKYIPSFLWKFGIEFGCKVKKIWFSSLMQRYIPLWIHYVLAFLLGVENERYPYTIELASILGSTTTGGGGSSNNSSNSSSNSNNIGSNNNNNNNSFSGNNNGSGNNSNNGVGGSFEKNYHHNKDKDNSSPPPVLVALCAFTFLAMFVNPDGLTWIMLSEVSQWIQNSFHKASHFIRMLREGSIKITLAELSGTIAGIIIIVTILGALFYPDNKNVQNQRNQHHHQRKSHKHKKGKKKNGRHYHNSTAGVGNKSKIRPLPSRSTNDFQQTQGEETIPSISSSSSSIRDRSCSDMEDTTVSAFSDSGVNVNASNNHSGGDDGDGDEANITSTSTTKTSPSGVATSTTTTTTKSCASNKSCIAITNQKKTSKPQIDEKKSVNLKKTFGKKSTLDKNKVSNRRRDCETDSESIANSVNSRDKRLSKQFKPIKSKTNFANVSSVGIEMNAASDFVEPDSQLSTKSNPYGSKKQKRGNHQGKKGKRSKQSYNSTSSPSSANVNHHNVGGNNTAKQLKQTYDVKKYSKSQKFHTEENVQKRFHKSRDFECDSTTGSTASYSISDCQNNSKITCGNSGMNHSSNLSYHSTMTAQVAHPPTYEHEKRNTVDSQHHLQNRRRSFTDPMSLSLAQGLNNVPVPQASPKRSNVMQGQTNALESNIYGNLVNWQSNQQDNKSSTVDHTTSATNHSLFDAPTSYNASEQKFLKQNQVYSHFGGGHMERFNDNNGQSSSNPSLNSIGGSIIRPPPGLLSSQQIPASQPSIVARMSSEPSQQELPFLTSSSTSLYSNFSSNSARPVPQISQPRMTEQYAMTSSNIDYSRQRNMMLPPISSLHQAPTPIGHERKMYQDRNDDDELEANLQALGGQMVGSILD